MAQHFPSLLMLSRRLSRFVRLDLLVEKVSILFYFPDVSVSSNLKSSATNCEKFNADGSLMGRTNLDKSVW